MRFTRSQWVGSVVGIGAVLFASQLAQAAPIAVVSMRLQDTNGNDLANIAGVYTLTVGEQFQVVISASLTNPEITNNTRGTTTASRATRLKQLGLQELDVKLVTDQLGVILPGTTNGDLVTDPPKWTGLTDVTVANQAFGSALAFGKVNVLDNGTSPTGAGFVSASVSTPVQNWGAFNASANSLVQIGLGLDPTGGTTTLSGLPDDIQSGFYLVTGPGTTHLTPNIRVATAFIDSTASGTSTILSSEDITTSTSGVPITINVVPEPATLGLVGLGGLLILARRRKA